MSMELYMYFPLQTLLSHSRVSLNVKDWQFCDFVTGILSVLFISPMELEEINSSNTETPGEYF